MFLQKIILVSYFAIFCSNSMEMLPGCYYIDHKTIENYGKSLVEFEKTTNKSGARPNLNQYSQMGQFYQFYAKIGASDHSYWFAFTTQKQADEISKQMGNFPITWYYRKL